MKIIMRLWGRTVGDMIGVIGTLSSAKYVKSITTSVKGQAGGAAVTNEVISHASLGDSFANLFNTYVANADAFYEKILTDTDFASATWDGIVENGLNNFVDYFDPDHDGSVSATDIVNGYKKLFSPPPSFGTAVFEAQYRSSNKNSIKIETSNEEAKKEAVKEVTKHDEIKQVEINT